MTHANFRFINIRVYFVPPYGVGVNTIWSPSSDGSVVLMYKYHERREIDGRMWHLTLLN